MYAPFLRSAGSFLRLGQRQRRRRRHRQLLDRRWGSGLGRGGLERGGSRADHRGGARGLRRRLLGDRLAACRPRLRIGRARGHGHECRVVDRPGRCGAFLRLLFLEMLLQHLPALLLALLFVAAGADGAEQRRPLVDDHRADRGEQPAERELRREDERQEEQRQDQDDRAGAIQVLGEHARQRRAHVAAGAEFLAGDVQRAERQRQKRRGAAEEQRRAEGLGVGRVEDAAPEIVPADDGDDDWREVGGVADQLEGQFGQERADASREIRRRQVGAGVEEPDRVGRAVADERDQPEQRQREQRHTHDFAQPARESGSGQVRSP